MLVLFKYQCSNIVCMQDKNSPTFLVLLWKHVSCHMKHQDKYKKKDHTLVTLQCAHTHTRRTKSFTLPARADILE